MQGQRGVTMQSYEEKLKLARKVTENFFEIAATFAGKLTITFDERHRASQRACHRVPPN